MALALYRRYRPDTFDGVIGQDQVVVPLSRALDEGKLTHAYLFSGPRGCGKTSSARILARCINCEKGPTSHPCGTCESCRDLSANGAGSIDVVEIDAASHNGVDDARELRERAGFAPARDRYKIFILDEAHMVTQQGFNALLKIVEEPPEHVMFIFATTEPEKVIGTIRSRTHHYPFRLVPSEIMGPYLEKVCAQEKITPAAGVLKLAMRAGGGSVRDTLSVLDQLMVGSVDGTITYESASALLGFTPEALITDSLDAVINKDGSALYSTVEKVVVGGFEPRRFVEDLLARVRDLLVLTLAGKQAVQVFSDETEGEDAGSLTRQAKALGLTKLTQIAQQINDTLASMSGTTSPRMRLELLAAQLLATMEEPVVQPGAAQSAPVQSVTAQAGAAQVQPQTSQAQPAQSAPRGFNPPPRQSAPAARGAGVTAQSRPATPAQPVQQQSAPTAQNQTNAGGSGPSAAQTAPAQHEQPTQPGQPEQAQRADAPAPSEKSDMELWASALAQMPASLSSYVESAKVPVVEFSTNALGGKHLVFTFDKPLSQHAFALAVTNENRSVPGLVQNEVRKIFGATASIAPNNIAANGEVVQTVQSMSAQQRAAVKRDIALSAMKSATSVTPHAVEEQRESKTQADSSAAADSDADAHHAGVDSSTDDAAEVAAAKPAEPADVTSKTGSASSDGDADDSDPWANEPDESDETAELDKTGEAAEANGSTGKVVSGGPNLQAEATAQASQTAPADGIPDPAEPDDDDPWANADPEPEPEPASESEPVSRAGSAQQAQTNESHFNPGASPARAANAGAGANAEHPGAQPLNETSRTPEVSAEEDTYSLNDESLESSQVVPLEKLKDILDVKEVREIAPSDSH
jgi:DNA polymerase-3 subunit gamma/tau